MTAVEIENPETETFAVRVVATELHAGDGRTVDCRIVPYGERAQANDGLGGLPRGVMYDEEILPGAFDHQLNVAHRVLVNVEHEQGIGGVVGKGVALESRHDGLYGAFRMLETPNGETALQLVREGALGGVSFEAKFDVSRALNGVVQRVKANLRNIALCREPAYSRALVLGLRQAPAVILNEDDFPLAFDAELAKRIEALGLEVPERLKVAHPAYGTPASSGTPAAAPASENTSTDTEE